MKIWGISALHHDASLCVFENNKLLFASQAERYSRIKNDKHLNIKLINSALKYGAPDEVIWYEKPWKRKIREVFFDNNFKKSIDVYSYVNSFVSCTKMKYISHHEAHAAASLYTANFKTENAIALSIDAVGECCSASVYLVKNNTLHKVDSIRYPNSLGLFYSAFTKLLGYKPNEEEYIVMGMSSYGDPNRYYHTINSLTFKPKSIMTYYNMNKGCNGIIPQSVVDDNKFDIAAAVQRVYEEKLINLIKHYLHKYKTSKLLLSGGCALNCRANTKILNIVDDINIFFHPGDGGSSIGAVLASQKENVRMATAFHGHDAGQVCASNIVDEIEERGYAFVINGKAEFGPRALGHRSILADPRKKDMQEIINKIKGRELFRPFAPCILQEYFSDYFETKGLAKTPYMQYTLKCKKPDAIPAVVHIDGTSRVQTVDTNNYFLYKVLQLWYQKSKIPVLLNTSLNVRGKPLINSSEDMDEFLIK